MSNAARRAIYGALAADGTLTGMLGNVAPGYGTSRQGIYHDAAPDHAVPPYVVFSKSSGVPTDTFDKLGTSIFETEIWMIKAVDRNTTADTAEAIAARINTLLTNPPAGTISLAGTAGTPAYLRRESDVEYSELTDGDLYRHVGALYRLVRTN